MSERLEEIKGDWEAERCIKPENVEFLIGQSERAETLEMKYENSGSMFNRQNMQARIDELEHQNQKYREADEGEFLDNLIGRLYEYENQIIRYREAIKEASEIIKSLPRTYGKSRLSSVLVEALEGESE